MALKVEFHPQARLDLAAALDWYEKQKSDLSTDFLQHYLDTRIRIQEYPQSFRKIYGQFRKANIKKFPYFIVYRPYRKKIYILAIYHHKRDNTWKKRVH